MFISKMHQNVEIPFLKKIQTNECLITHPIRSRFEAYLGCSRIDKWAHMIRDVGGWYVTLAPTSGSLNVITRGILNACSPNIPADIMLHQQRNSSHIYDTSLY